MTFGNGMPVDLGVACHQCGQWHGTEVVGADRGERAAVAAEWGANGVADVGVSCHGRLLLVSRVQMRASRARAWSVPITGEASSISLPSSSVSVSGCSGSPLRLGCR